MIKKYFDLIMPEIILPSHGEKLGEVNRIKGSDSFECREAMFDIARYFRREFNFDAIQYANLYDKEDDNESYAYAFTLEFKEGKSLVIGTICFRKREWGGYGLQWVWLHPYVRNKGLLTQHWKLFREKFGNFYVEPPYSEAMKQFLKKTDKNRIHTNDDGKYTPSILSNIKNALKNNKS